MRALATPRRRQLGSTTGPNQEVAGRRGVRGRCGVGFEPRGAAVADGFVTGLRPAVEPPGSATTSGGHGRAGRWRRGDDLRRRQAQRHLSADDPAVLRRPRRAGDQRRTGAGPRGSPGAVLRGLRPLHAHGGRQPTRPARARRLEPAGGGSSRCPSPSLPYAPATPSPQGPLCCWSPMCASVLTVRSRSASTKPPSGYPSRALGFYWRRTGSTKRSWRKPCKGPGCTHHRMPSTPVSCTVSSHPRSCSTSRSAKRAGSLGAPSRSVVRSRPASAPSLTVCAASSARTSDSCEASACELAPEAHQACGAGGGPSGSSTARGSRGGGELHDLTSRRTDPTRRTSCGAGRLRPRRRRPRCRCRPCGADRRHRSPR
jgi:hypothetical protein